MPLPQFLPVPEIHERLQTIFPGGTANRNYVTREIAAKTVFVIEPLLVFVEVVATSGPVNQSRLTALMTIATEAGFTEEQVAFLTAYSDRDDPAFKGSVSELAWGSFAWFMSEPEHIVMLHRGADAERVRLSDLMWV